MREDGGADGAGPHPEAGSQLAGHLRVAAEVLAEAALVNVELPAHRTRVVGASPLSCTPKSLVLGLPNTHTLVTHTLW